MSTLRRGVTMTFLLLLSARAMGQGLPSGSIAGSVKTEADAQPLPGVEVSVRSPALQGTRRTASAGNGDFLLANLPPGEYAVELRLPGFRAVARSGVRVGTAQRQDLEVAMGLEAVSAEVEVSAAGELVSTSPQSASTVDGALLARLPVTRSFESAVLLSPDVFIQRSVAGGGPASLPAFSIAGAEVDENFVTIDGVSPQENSSRLSDPHYIEDAVAEVTTLTSGIPAQHGYFVGGVVNVLTKTGGNAFAGSLRSTLVNDAWTARTAVGEERVSDLTPVWEATAGGPFWKDRAWFFVAGRLRDQTTVSALAPPANFSYPTRQRETRFDAKLTASPAAGHVVTLALSGLDRKEWNRAQDGFPVIDTASLFDQSLEERMLAANYTGTIADKLFVEAHYGKRTRTMLAGSTDMDLYSGTPILYPSPWLSYHAAGLCSVCPDPEDRRNSDQGVVEATWFVPTHSLGSHTVIAGGEAYRGAMSVNSYQSGTDYAVFGSDLVMRGDEIYPVFGPGTEVWFMPILEPAAPYDIRTYSAFVDDTWRVSERLTLDLGLRWDKNHGRDAGGGLISDAGAFSPRLGVAWDPSGKGRTRLTASYGRYASTLNEFQVYGSSPYGLFSLFVYPYDGPPVNTDPTQPLLGGTDALRRLFDWYGVHSRGQFPRPDLVPVTATIPGVNVRIRGGLEPKRADEWALGINGSIGARGRYRVEGVERKYGNFYDIVLDRSTGTVTDAYGNVYDLGVLTNVNAPWERRHRALKASAELPVGTSLRAGGSWTWSRTWGNKASELPMPEIPWFTLSTYPEYWDMAWRAPVGDLTQDMRHRIRLWAVWNVPSLPRSMGSLEVGGIFALDSGQPYGASGMIPISDYVQNPGYVAPPSRTIYWFTGRDAFRTPTVTHLDLSVTWSLRFLGLEAFVQPQVTNVFNEGALATSDGNFVDLGVATAAHDPSLEPFDPFHEKPVEGVHWRKSPTFGQALTPEAYQQPRTFRVSLGVRF